MSLELPSALKNLIATLLPNGLGARGDEERHPKEYPLRHLHVLLATSGSVASIKAPLIVRELLKVRASPARPHRRVLTSPLLGSTTEWMCRSSRPGLRCTFTTRWSSKRSMRGESRSGPTRKSGRCVAAPRRSVLAANLDSCRGSRRLGTRFFTLR